MFGFAQYTQIDEIIDNLITVAYRDILRHTRSQNFSQPA